MFAKEIHGWDTELPLMFIIYGSATKLKTTLANDVSWVFSNSIWMRIHKIQFGLYHWKTEASFSTHAG